MTAPKKEEHKASFSDKITSGHIWFVLVLIGLWFVTDLNREMRGVRPTTPTGSVAVQPAAVVPASQQPPGYQPPPAYVPPGAPESRVVAAAPQSAVTVEHRFGLPGEYRCDQATRTPAEPGNAWCLNH